MRNEKRPKLRSLTANQILTRVYELAVMQCTPKEIAAVIGITESDVHQLYGETIRKGKADGHHVLRIEQWHTAITKKSEKMQMWLGKQYLGQREPDKVVKEIPAATPEEAAAKLREMLEKVKAHSDAQFGGNAPNPGGFKH